MKMIFAGLSSDPNAAPEKILYNCTRNPACQTKFYIPVPDLSKLFLFFDLTIVGNPETYEINIINCNGDITATDFCNFVIGQRYDNSWYAIFTGLRADILPPGTDNFYFKATFTAGANTYVYYSNEITVTDCVNILEVESCYNDTSAVAIPTDCNGIYYGYHSGDDLPSGNVLLRYFHKVWLRFGEIVETKNKFQFSIFNNQTSYKNYFTRQYTLQCEQLPKFMKDILIGVLNRGTIGILNETYTLTPTQDIAQADENTKLWKILVTMDNLCKQFFSCTPTDCGPVMQACTGNFTDAVITLGDPSGFTLSGGYLSDGDTIVWHLYEDEIQVDNGATDTDSQDFSIIPNTAEHCYRLDWKKVCNNGCSSGQTSFNHKTFGLCSECCTPEITGNSVEVSGDDNVLTIDFTPCSPAPDGFNVRYRPQGTTGSYRDGGNSFTSPIVITDSLDAPGTLYEGYLRADCGEGNFGPDVPFANDWHECGDNIADVYAGTDTHFYPSYWLNTTGVTTMHVLWNSHDRPNRFTIYDTTTNLQVATTGWHGYAPYFGPWGPTLNNAQSGDLSFNPNPTHIYRLLVEAGGANPITPESDSFDLDLSCD